MELDLPVRGLEPLTPLLAYLILYALFLIFLRLFLWPLFLLIRRRRTLPRLLASLALIGVRMLLALALVGGLLWAITVIGLDERFYDTLDSLPSFSLPVVGEVPLLLLLLIALALFVILPALVPRARARAPRR